MNEILLGYIGAIIASIFFGSNYVPTKNYPMGDGFAFVWIFASAVLIVGIISIFIVGEAIWVYTGLLGGSLWAMGNLCVIPIVKLIGLGLGMLLWCAANLVTGFFVGKFHWFGLPPDNTVKNNGMNWGGIVLILVATGVVFFIKPTLETKTEKTYIRIDEDSKLNVNTDSEEEASWMDRIPKGQKYFMGIGLAVFSGILYGLNLVPMQVWRSDPTHNQATLAFVFSHFVGIYFFSTIVFIIYCIIVRPPKIFPTSILPAMVSGAMWGIAQCGLMSATAVLKFTVGFPIGSAGPMIVSTLWSIFYFREIRGTRNYMLVTTSFVILLAGIALLILSKEV
eukprot:TRINITY_DN1614_c0_g1_i1.p1 TRINITY_DN1614_c0_g1~~TRINITY_DN1614_c0_g1_i1.p1  ORF type:complete len:337 (-),score=62.16 TRINITY_DN1614_c0_g1_i1:35-1045(-)